MSAENSQMSRMHELTRASILQFARQFLEKGNRVIAGVRSPGAAQDLAALGGGAVTVLPLDVTSPQSIIAWAEQVRGATDHVDVRSSRSPRPQALNIG